MKQKKKILWMLLTVLVFGGCGSQESVLKRVQQESSSLEEQQEPETTDSVETGNGQEEKPVQVEEALPEWIYVDVCGAVESPGVYRVEAGSRVFQVLEKAGGCTEDASLETVNQAGLLSDGQKIRIYTREEAEQMGSDLREESQGMETGSEASSDMRVDINRAGKEELMTLTGVGETRAEAILAYRESHGKFSSVEELMQVEGIKEKTYEKLKDQIRIN